VQDHLFGKRLSGLSAGLALAGGQEWRSFSVAASSAKHSSAPSWHQDTCRSNSSWLWHPRRQLTENSRNWPDTSCYHTCHDAQAGHQCRYYGHRTSRHTSVASVQPALHVFASICVKFAARYCRSVSRAAALHAKLSACHASSAPLLYLLQKAE